MISPEHRNHLINNVSHSNCPECRADCSRRFARATPFVHTGVPAEDRHKYFLYVKARLDAIRTGENGGSTIEARQWLRYDFLSALHKRISSHLPNQNGRKHAPEYAKYHLGTYGNDRRFLSGQ